MKKLKFTSELQSILLFLSFNLGLGIFPAFSQVQFNNFQKIDLENSFCSNFINHVENKMNTSSLIVLKDGESLLERYYAEANPKTRTKVWSISKFLTGLTLGAIVQERGFELLDQSLEDLGIQRTNHKKDKFKWSEVKLRHIWNMSSGIDWCEYANCKAVDAAMIMYGEGNYNSLDYVLRQSLKYRPGTYYRYSSGNYVLLQAVFQKLYEKSQGASRLPYTKVLQPLGLDISDYTFELDQKGLLLGGSGLHITSRGLAKLGQLVLNRGMWKNRQIIHKDFYDEMIRNSYAIKNSPFKVQNWEGPAGGSVWLNDDSSDGRGVDRDGVPAFMPTSPKDMIYAGGNLGQFLLIYPSQGLVLVRTGGDQDFSSHWKPVSEKFLKCMAPEALRSDLKPKKNKKAPKTGKNMSIFKVAKEKIVTRSRAQELCSCLYVTGYSSIEMCDKMVPSEQNLFIGITTHNIIQKPSLRVSPEGFQEVWVRGKLGKKVSKSRYIKNKNYEGCQIIK